MCANPHAHIFLQTTKSIKTKAVQKPLHPTHRKPLHSSAIKRPGELIVVRPPIVSSYIKHSVIRYGGTTGQAAPPAAPFPP